MRIHKGNGCVCTRAHVCKNICKTRADDHNSAAGNFILKGWGLTSFSIHLPPIGPYVTFGRGVDLLGGLCYKHS